MYVDESGDVGQVNSPTRYFILSSIILHESNWLQFITDLNDFRRQLKATYGLLKREEIHAQEFISRRPPLRANPNRNIKLQILIDCLSWLGSRNDIQIITVRMEKNKPGQDIFELTWTALIQRLENTLINSNFSVPAVARPSLPHFFQHQKGVILSDNTDGGKLNKLIRKLRHINFIANNSAYAQGARNLPLNSIVEDLIMRDSAYSYIHQMADVVAYFAKQYYQPNSFILATQTNQHYSLLKNIIITKATYRPTFCKIVEL